MLGFSGAGVVPSLVSVLTSPLVTKAGEPHTAASAVTNGQQPKAASAEPALPSLTTKPAVRPHHDEDQTMSHCIPGHVEGTFWSSGMEFMSMIVVAVSIVTFIVASNPHNRLECHSQARCSERNWQEMDEFHVEMACTIWFTIEFFWRIYIAADQFAHFKQALTWIDFFAAFPFYFALLNQGSSYGIVALRALRISRLFRVLSVSRFFISIQEMGQCLLATQRELALFLIVIAVLVILSGTVVFFCESDQHDTDFISIPASLWWAMMTVTTIGCVGGTRFVGLVGALTSCTSSRVECMQQLLRQELHARKPITIVIPTNVVIIAKKKCLANFR